MSKSVAENLRCFRIEVDEGVAIPVGLELRREFIEDVRKVLGRDFQIPFQTAVIAAWDMFEEPM